MSTAPLLELKGLRRAFYGLDVLRGVDLAVAAGGITGLIGPNGAGKTTLFNVVSGLVPPDAGSIRFDGQEIAGLAPDAVSRRGLVRTFQVARGFPRLSVFQHLMLYGRDQPGETLWQAILGTRAAREREAALAERAWATARFLRLDHLIDNPATALSGGQKKLLEIGRALMAEPRLVLLDEPTAGVNPTLQNEIGERLLELPRRGITVLLIEHRFSPRARSTKCVPTIGCARPISAEERHEGRGMSLLEIAGLRGGYAAADEIVKGADLSVAAGEIVALIGPNGAGKSTLLKLVAGLLRPSGGSVRFKDREIAGWAAPDISRAGLSFVPQERNVFGTMSVAENLEMGGYIDGKHASKRMAELYERFPMLADKRRAAARTLSGGQRQILAMAVALMNAPDLLLLDEPTAGLSPRAAEELFGTILALNQSGVAILMVEQNALEALSVSARAYVLVQGRPEREGGAADLAADPTVRDLFLGGKATPMVDDHSPLPR